MMSTYEKSCRSRIADALRAGTPGGGRPRSGPRTSSSDVLVRSSLSLRIFCQNPWTGCYYICDRTLSAALGGVGMGTPARSSNHQPVTGEVEHIEVAWIACGAEAERRLERAVEDERHHLFVASTMRA